MTHGFRKVNITAPRTPKARKSGRVGWHQTPPTRRLMEVYSNGQPVNSTAYRLAHAGASYVAAGTAAGVATAAFGPEVSAPAALWGGVAGAVRSWNATGEVSSKKTMAGKINSRVDKSSMKMSGKAKVKRVKPLKVSPYLKKAIKQTVSGLTAHGVYKRSFHGVIGNSAVSIVADKKDVSNDIVMYNAAAQTGSYVPSAWNRPFGLKTWFNALAYKGTTGSNFVTLVNTDLNFFTPGKIWHAASVLFNKKPETFNPYQTTSRNLSLTAEDTTGIRSESARGVKINVLDSYVTFTMKNLSSRTIFVDIYECVSTMKFNGNNPLTDARTLCLDLQDTTNAPGSDRTVQLFEITQEQGSDLNYSFLCDPHTDAIAVLKNNGYKWKYVKRSMMLASGEMCTHSVKGPKGMLDLQKCWDPSTSTYKVNNALKDWSKHVMMSVRADPVLLEGGTNFNQGARATPSVAGFQELFGVVSVEVTEAFKLSVPEIAGFISTAVTAGQGQTLNLRKKRYNFTNLGIGSATGLLNTAAIVNATEFQPTQTTSTGILL